MPVKKTKEPAPSRRRFTDEFKQEAVQMLLVASSVAERLGLPGPNSLYRWKREQLERSGRVWSYVWSGEYIEEEIPL